MQTTREKEIETALRLGVPDSGVSPVAYDAHLSKEALLRHAPAPKIGTSLREGKVKHPKSLSVSRSIQHGIDYRVPVVMVPVPPATARSSPPPPL